MNIISVIFLILAIYCLYDTYIIKNSTYTDIIQGFIPTKNKHIKEHYSNFSDLNGLSLRNTNIIMTDINTLS